MNSYRCICTFQGLGLDTVGGRKVCAAYLAGQAANAARHVLSSQRLHPSITQPQNGGRMACVSRFFRLQTHQESEAVNIQDETPAALAPSDHIHRQFLIQRLGF